MMITMRIRDEELGPNKPTPPPLSDKFNLDVKHKHRLNTQKCSYPLQKSFNKLIKSKRDKSVKSGLAF